MEPLLSAIQVGEILGISDQAVKALLRSGELQGHKVRGKWRVSTEQVQEYLERRKNK